MIVEKLADGNYVVRAGFVHKYFKTIAENIILKIKLKECEDALKEK